MVYEASELDGALSCIRSMTAAHMDLVILDTALCNDAADAVRVVQRAGGRAPVVVLGHDINAIDDQLLAADSVLNFDITAEMMIHSLLLVQKGERVVPRELMWSIAAPSQGSRRQSASPAPLPPPQNRSQAPSPREVQILRRLLEGQPNKTIARELGITETTVKFHLKSLLRKVSASNRTQEAIWALNNGYTAFGAPPGGTGARQAKQTEIDDGGRHNGPRVGNGRGKPH